MKKIVCTMLLCLLMLGHFAIAEETYFSFDSSSETTTDTQETATQTTSTAETETSGTQQAEESTDEKVWTYVISQEILEDPLDVIQLVNRNNLLEKDYPPSGEEMYALDESSVKKTKNVDMKVRPITSEALIRMFADADAEGINLRLHSAYRSYQTQSTMYSNRLERIGKDDGVVQYPGASEHQTGLAVDIINPAWINEERLNSRFAETAEAKWMAENCAKYGFIIRYPADKEEITGITYEPWHLRYVGVEVATYIMENGLSLEEFTSEWRHELAQYELNNGGGGAIVTSFNF